MSRPATNPDELPAPQLIGVGMGPGDPALVTIKAAQILAQADVILVPETEESSGGAGRAEAIVAAVCPEASSAIVRVPFSMSDRSGVTGKRQQAWLTSADRALAAFDDGARIVAQATIGDPGVYSTFSYLAAHVRDRRPDVVVSWIPGITAMQALAAASQIPLVEGTESLALVPVTAGLANLSAMVEQVDTVVAYKGGRRTPEVVELIRQSGRQAVLGVHLGQAEEQILELDDLAPDSRLPYLSTIMVKANRTSTGGRL